MTVDPTIEALFGPPPLDIDLAASYVAANRSVVIVLLFLAIIAVALRFIARITLRNALLADDWVIFVALVQIISDPKLSVSVADFHGSSAYVPPLL